MTRPLSIFIVVGALIWTSISVAQVNGLVPDVDDSSQQRSPRDVGIYNKTVVVTTILSKPYVMLKESDQGLRGNEKFEGFLVDVIDELSRHLYFNYVLKLVEDSKYGNKNQETREWDGMIGELLNARADIALGDLTITHDREVAVDFTMPILNTGISVLYKKPSMDGQETEENDSTEHDLFSFLAPFSLDVWIYIFVAYVAVLFILFAISRISPYERRKVMLNTSDAPESNSVVLDSLWFPLGASPRALSTRLLTGVWWLFAIIILASYTANLVVILNVEKSPVESSVEPSFSSAEELAGQSTIRYGTVESGSTRNFFRKSNFPAYQRMSIVMESSPSVYTRSNIEGVERVQRSNGSYAFLMESTSIEYFVARRCDLIQVGSPLDMKAYGIALRPKSPYRDAINLGLLKLLENNRIIQLKNKWWREKNGGVSCNKEKDDQEKDNESNSSEPDELDMSKLGGIFIILAIGCILALLISLVELAWERMRSS